MHRVRLEFSGAAGISPANGDVGGITCQRDWHGGQEHLRGRGGWKSLTLRRKGCSQFRCLTLSLEANYHQARSRAPNRCDCWYQPSTLAGQGSGGGLFARYGAGSAQASSRAKPVTHIKPSLVHFLKQSPNSLVRGWYPPNLNHTLLGGETAAGLEHSNLGWLGVSEP